jgi:hypothetical protein
MMQRQLSGFSNTQWATAHSSPPKRFSKKNYATKMAAHSAQGRSAAKTQQNDLGSYVFMLPVVPNNFSMIFQQTRIFPPYLASGIFYLSACVV